MRTSTACDIGPKGKARIFELRASSGYLTPSNGYIGFPYYPLVRPKRHGTACDIGPKGEARTHGTACAIGPKGEARTFELRASSGYLTPSNGYIGFPYHPHVLSCTLMVLHGCIIQQFAGAGGELIN